MAQKALTQMSDALPSVFDDFFRPWGEWFDNTPRFQRALSVPAVNVTEDDKAYKVTLAVPGLDKNDFNVDVNGNLLTISAEKEQDTEEKEKRYTRREYNYTSFSRSFTLPEEIAKEKIEAKYDNGILSLSLPKIEKTGKGGSNKIKIA